MSSTGHFSRVSKELLRYFKDDFLHDIVIAAHDGTVSLHSLIFIIFSSSFRERYPKKTPEEVPVKGFNKTEVANLVEFLYGDDEKLPSNSLEIIKALKLDLVVDQKIRRKKTSKTVTAQSIIDTEVKYLRNLTFEMMIQKLLEDKSCIPDMSVRTGKHLHNCHKIIISANSLYFELMLASGMKESSSDIIHLQGVDTEIFKLVLTYMYSGYISITTDNAQDLLSTAVYLQIPVLQTISEEFLLQQIDPDNCVDILVLGRLYNCQNLIDGAWTFMVDNFCLLPKSKLFSSLKLSSTCNLLKDTNLNVSSETDVIKFIMEWIKNSTSLTENDFQSLFECCRFTLFDDTYLEEFQQNNSLVLDKNNCGDILRDVITKQKQSNEDMLPRKEKTFVVIKRSSYTTGIEAACYSLSQKAWYCLKTNTLCEGGTGFVCCMVDDSIIVTGGTATPKCVTQYLVHENRWKDLPEMNEGRSSHAIGYAEGKVYVLGGSDHSAGAFNIVPNIEKYSFQDNKWTNVGKMEIPTYDSAYAVVKSRIYILGGSMGIMSGVYIKDIQCFDTITETCTKLYHNLPTTLSLADACVNNKDVYITCPNGSVIYYNEDRAPVKINETSGSQLMGFSTLYHDSAIYIMGGYSIHGESDAIRKFDLKTNTEMKFATKLPFKKQTNQLFATTMYVSRRFLTTVYPVFNEKPKSRLRASLTPRLSNSHSPR